MRQIVFALCVSVLAAGCASSGTAAGNQAATGNTTRARQNVITLQEIRESRAPSLFDLVRQLRPGWPLNQVTVFVNNDPLGAVQVLSSLSVNNTAEIRFLSKSEAQFKWGTRFNEVVQVITR